MKVLIVDGSKQNRRNVVEALGQLTNVVVQGAVAEARTALYAIAEATPDVLVACVPLPDDDGMHLIERVRRLARTPSIVVVASASEHDQRARYLAAGADRYVEARDDLSELQEAVATLGRSSRASGAIPHGQTERLLGRMAAGVAHDVNNHLTGLEVTFTMLQRSPEDLKLWLQMRHGLDALARLNSTVLEYARGGVPTTTPLDLGAIVRDTLALAARSIPDNVEVSLAIAENLGVVIGVRSELEQLVLNLVINAYDAMADGGELAIVVQRTASGVLLEVADTGGSKTPPRRASGASLGLGIVHSVVDRYGGAIRIVPQPEGGTRVAVMFPAR